MSLIWVGTSFQVSWYPWQLLKRWNDSLRHFFGSLYATISIPQSFANCFVIFVAHSIFDLSRMYCHDRKADVPVIVRLKSSCADKWLSRSNSGGDVELQEAWISWLEPKHPLWGDTSSNWVHPRPLPPESFSQQLVRADPTRASDAPNAQRYRFLLQQFLREDSGFWFVQRIFFWGQSSVMWRPFEVVSFNKCSSASSWTSSWRRRSKPAGLAGWGIIFSCLGGSPGRSVLFFPQVSMAYLQLLSERVCNSAMEADCIPAARLLSITGTKGNIYQRSISSA